MYRYIPAPGIFVPGIIFPPGSIVLGAVMLLYTGGTRNITGWGATGPQNAWGIGE